ncbi:unnamed protein product [Moneuplotes crassus]|uniref:Uncharacterized protein n=1 Tax=Euplotes crassus TaxID=5936 RepID=A0AAD1XER2_EUPCR|nr:unnamed protein product [Moneuplotes crassus]
MPRSPLKDCNSIQSMIDYFSSKRLSKRTNPPEVRERGINVSDFIRYLTAKSAQQTASFDHRPQNKDAENMGLRIKKINLKSPSQMEQFEHISNIKKKMNNTFMENLEYYKVLPKRRTNFWCKRYRNPSVQELLKDQNEPSNSPRKSKLVSYPYFHIKSRKNKA